MIYFTSDTHFGHFNIIRICNRPFQDLASHDETIIEKWNNKVAPTDIVYHLGDFAYRCSSEYCAQILRRLNGQIILIPGNHEKVLFETYKRYSEFKNKIIICGGINYTNNSVVYEIEIEKRKIILCHYGMRTWNGSFRGSWHLYGHSHGNLPPLFKSMDIGVDCTNFEPLSFNEVKEIMNANDTSFSEI
jgi:calcineurin-like phosphoesterase family protein